MKLGIVSATREEQDGLLDLVEDKKVFTNGGREYTTGRIAGVEVVIVLCRIGKVAAAVTTTALITLFDVTHILFTGVAGAGNSDVKIGDIVIGSELVQHDMRGAPMYLPFEIPLLHVSHFETDPKMTFTLSHAVTNFLRHDFKTIISDEEKDACNIVNPKPHIGLIASGDEFVSTAQRRDEIYASLSNEVLAVEMEGAAIAQVCYEYNIPFAIMRTISDDANEQSTFNYPWFIERISSPYAFHIVKRFIETFAHMNTPQEEDDHIQNT